MAFEDFDNVYQVLRDTVEQRPDGKAYGWILDSGEIESITWGQFSDQVKQAAKSLIALGVNRGDKVNILSYTCYRWILTDVALMSIGACTVGIYQTLLAKDCRYIVDHSDAVLVFAEDEDQLAKLREIRAEIPDIRKVVLFKGDPGGDDWVISYDAFLELSKDVADEEFERRAAAVTSDDRSPTTTSPLRSSPSTRASRLRRTTRRCCFSPSPTCSRGRLCSRRCSLATPSSSRAASTSSPTT
jgi:long-chain acyl-CoA synthetase